MLTSIAKKTIMAVSGTLLSGFIIVHGIGNATAFWGKEAFLNYSKHLHSLGILINISEFFLLVAFLAHIYFGLSLYLENLKARPNRYSVKKNAGGRTFGSMSMPYTGAITFIFLLVHLKGFHFIETIAPINEIVLQTLQVPVMALFYLVSLMAVTLHISHGFWSLLQTFGLNHPQYNNKLEKGALFLSILVGAVFILIPVSALFCDSFLQ